MSFLEAYYLIGVVVFLLRRLGRPPIDWSSLVDELVDEAAKLLSGGDPLQFYGEEEEFLAVCRIFAAISAVIGLTVLPLLWPLALGRRQR